MFFAPSAGAAAVSGRMPPCQLQLQTETPYRISKPVPVLSSSPRCKWPRYHGSRSAMAGGHVQERPDKRLGEGCRGVLRTGVLKICEHEVSFLYPNVRVMRRLHQPYLAQDVSSS